MKNMLIDKNRGKMRMRMRMYVAKFLAVREDLKNFQRCSNIAPLMHSSSDSFVVSYFLE